MNHPRRGTASSQLRSPFENILNMFQLSGLPQGHEKPLKHAFYNAAALFLLFLSSVAAYGLFLILQPFFKPLLWALLVGSVLYPMKRKLAKQINVWMINLEKSNTSLVVGIFKLPFSFIDKLSELLGSWLSQHITLLIILLVTLPSLHCFYYYTPLSLTCVMWRSVLLSNALFAWIISCFSTKLVLTLACCHALSVFFLWTPERMNIFKHTSLVAWLIFSAYLSNVLGMFQVPLFIILQVTAFAGFFYQGALENSDDEKIQEKAIEPNEPPTPISKPTITSTNAEGDGTHETAPPKTEDKLETPQITSTNIRPFNLNPKKQTEENEPGLDSDIYFRYLFYACGFLLLWKQLWVLPLIPIPVIVFLSKRLWKFCGMHEKVMKHFEYLKIRFEERRESLIPIPVQGLITLFKWIHTTTFQLAIDSVDSVSSAAVILLLLSFLTCAVLFISVQIYAEVIQMVQMGSSVINNTILHNPELLGMLPPEVEESMDNMLENAYQYGRDGISKLVHSFLQDVDSVQAQRLETQLLTLWDRAYQSWMDNPNPSISGPRVPQEAVKLSFESFMEDLYRSPELFNMEGITNWAKQNIGTLTGVLESAWTLLRGNLELLLGLVTAVMHLLLGSSSAVITWLLNSVVFLTTLFYLLASSGQQYRPVEAIGAVVGGSAGRTARGISTALEEAVAGVFLATFKMSVFYGLWTWLIHNIFGTSVVYLPTVMASILAAIPFLGTYWACFAGVLELWFVQGRFWSAVGLAVFQFAPTTLLDATLYNEIKGGGHPYLTGLSIAGGLWCLGPEGALLGPLLLCLLVVVTDLSSAALRESPVNEPSRRLQRLI